MIVQESQKPLVPPNCCLDNERVGLNSEHVVVLQEIYPWQRSFLAKVKIQRMQAVPVTVNGAMRMHADEELLVWDETYSITTRYVAWSSWLDLKLQNSISYYLLVLFFLALLQGTQLICHYYRSSY